MTLTTPAGRNHRLTIVNAVVLFFAATPIAAYTSYAQFSADLSDGAFPAGYSWVMFGLESTTNSPLVEKQHPDVYLRKFARLAHEHGWKVMEVPGVDLVGVAGSDCRARKGEHYDAAYLRCHIPADSAGADIVLVEAQHDQASVSAYASLVERAAAQARKANPKVTVMARLSTDRGDSAAAIEACWRASHHHVSGYWMNSSRSTLALAARVLNYVRTTAGG